MRFALHVARLVASTLRFGIATRSISLLVVLLLGLVALFLAFTAQTVAPLVFYPFA